MRLTTQALEAFEPIEFVLAGASISFLSQVSLEDREMQPALRHRALRQLGEPDVVSAETLPEAIKRNWSRFAHSGLDEQAFAKLQRMASREAGWRGPGSLSLRASALKSFLSFWGHVRESASMPQFALLPTGHLQALWTSSRGQRMDLEFTGDSRVYFGLLSGRRRVEGVESLTSLAKILLAHPEKPLRWK